MSFRVHCCTCTCTKMIHLLYKKKDIINKQSVATEWINSRRETVCDKWIYSIIAVVNNLWVSILYVSNIIIFCTQSKACSFNDSHMTIAWVIMVGSINSTYLNTHFSFAEPFNSLRDHHWIWIEHYHLSSICFARLNIKFRDNLGTTKKHCLLKRHSIIVS